MLNISITKLNKNPPVGAQPIRAGRYGCAHVAKLIGVLRDYIRTRLTAGRAIVKWLIVGLSLPRPRLILSLICILSEVYMAAGRSGIESRWGRDFPPVQTGPLAHPDSCKMGTGSFPGVKCGRGVLLTTHSLLVPRSWKSRAIPLPTLWATPGL